MNSTHELIDSTAQALFQEVGNSATLSLAQAKTIARQAGDLIGNYIKNSVIPDSVLSLALLAVSRDLYTQSQAPGGVFTPFGDGSAVRLARDPMKAAYPLLIPYLKGGFA